MYADVFGRKFRKEDMTLRPKCRVMGDVKVDLRKWRAV